MLVAYQSHPFSEFKKRLTCGEYFNNTVYADAEGNIALLARQTGSHPATGRITGTNRSMALFLLLNGRGFTP